MDAHLRFRDPATTDPEPSLPTPSVTSADENTYAAAVLHFLSDAVRNCARLNEGRDRLQQHRVGRKLMQVAGRIHARQDTHDLSRPPAGCFSAYELIVYCHISTILCRRNLARVFLRHAHNEADASGQLFWQEYARGVEAVMTGRPYAAREIPVACSLEQYWLAYLDFMETITHGGDIPRALESVDHAFAARNADLHISQDWFGIEGSARAKVRWDYRKDAILLAFQQQNISPAGLRTYDQ